MVVNFSSIVERFTRAFQESLNQWDTAFKAFANFLFNGRISQTNIEDMATNGHQ